MVFTIVHTILKINIVEKFTFFKDSVYYINFFHGLTLTVKTSKSMVVQLTRVELTPI